jgi:UDP-2,3-diacylglucosamine pyrophosphatase LpxH
MQRRGGDDMTDIFEIAVRIDGWLDRLEIYRLHQLAGEIPLKGTIVEIGSYRGRSTVVLALGAQPRKGKVYAIDTFEGVKGDTHISGHDRDILGYALANNGVTDSVEIITAKSLAAAKKWSKSIDLLFLDGSHEYEDVLADLNAWSPHVAGLIACHDHNENWPGVPQAVSEFVAKGDWRVAEQVDATVVLERVGEAKAVTRS